MCSFAQNYLVRYSLLACLCLLLVVTLVVLGLDLDLLINGPAYLAKVVTNIVNRWTKEHTIDQMDLVEVLLVARESLWVHIPMIILVVVTTIMVVVIVVGFLGASLMSYSLLSGFTMAVFLNLIVVAAVVIWVLVSSAENSVLDQFLMEKMRQLQGQEDNSGLFGLVLDTMQRDLQCCGLKSPTDWLEAGPLPPSCCPSSCSASGWDCGAQVSNCRQEEAYTSSCLEVVRSQVLQPGTLVGSIGITVMTLVCLMVATFFLSTCLCLWARTSGRREEKMDRSSLALVHHWNSPTNSFS